MPVITGLERLLDSPRLSGQRIGLVANPSSVDRRLEHAANRLAARRDVTLGALFGPQHGFHANLQDNMIETPHERDERRRVPVYSLYSETREPTPDMLEGLDLLVIDLQDVGARIYTFIYTMANCLKAAGRTGLPVIVCDRPNPIGGTAVEGPMLEPGYESFVGLFPIPMRHGMTVGELASLFNEAFGLGAALEVVPMEGWRRDMYFDGTELPWVIPSPNMPTLDTAIVYPGAVLFEGTQLSEGRGTTRPFELVGAPWIDAERLAQSLNALGLPGTHFRPTYFEPTFHKFAGQTCGGCQLHVTDRRSFRPVLASVAWMRELHQQAPARFAWRQPPYEYEDHKMPIDILAGSDRLRRQIEAGTSAQAIAEEWEEGVAAFARVRAQFLRY
jgi:uncharacterized protein YbbC (DUF1343 family)